MSRTIHTACRVQRRIQVTRATFDAATGKWSDGAEQWHNDPCGKLLCAGSGDDVVAGVCGSCLRGWQTETNHPTAEGANLIAEAKKRREDSSR